MIARLASFLSGGAVSKVLMSILVGLIAVFAGLWLWVRADAAELRTDIQQQMTQITQMQTSIDNFKLKIALEEKVKKVLEQRIEEERRQALELQDRLNEISQAPESDNGPVAPVLRKSISRLPN